MTLGLSMIIKDETESLLRLNESIQFLPLNQKVAVFTGTNPHTRSILEYLGFQVFDFQWVDDFAKARNFSKSKLLTDWMLWLDADDAVENAQNIWNELREAEKQNLNAIHADYIYDINCVVSRERVVRTKDFEWVGALHEALIPYEKCRIHLSKSFSVVHDYKLTPRHERLQRNLDIAKKDYENIKTLQSVFAYGLALFDAKDFDSAIKIFKESLNFNLPDQHRYLASLKIAYSYMYRNNVRKCLRWCNQGLKLFPEIAEAMWVKAMCMFRMKDWFNCVQYSKWAMQLKEPKDWHILVNKNLYRHIGPLMLDFASKKYLNQEVDIPPGFELAYNEINA